MGQQGQEVGVGTAPSIQGCPVALPKRFGPKFLLYEFLLYPHSWIKPHPDSLLGGQDSVGHRRNLCLDQGSSWDPFYTFTSSKQIQKLGFDCGTSFLPQYLSHHGVLCPLWSKIRESKQQFQFLGIQTNI